ncbi:transposase [Yersinia entomophaga]|uniref:Transposase n=1 Tax=Yersinia entomophaga TaxID=935293 RepID=A0ABN4Q3E2_YERET|nr:transposase [Yersinia entomophaga]
MNQQTGAQSAPVLLCTENLQLGWRFGKAFSFEPVIKTPFDLLKQFAVWQLQMFNKKSKGGPYEGRKELSAHAMEL